MTKLPERDWITLSESARRVAQAIGAELSAVEPELVAAFHDCKIRTRGRCRPCFENDRLQNLPSLFWDRAHVLWQINKFAIRSKQLGPKMYLVWDVEVCREDMEKWINGAMPDSQHGSHEAVENPPLEPPAPDQWSPSEQSKQTRRKKPAKQMHDRWVKRAKELKESESGLGTSAIARKIRSEDTKSKDPNTKGKTRDVQTIRRVLYEHRSEWEMPQKS